jgi:hypothetical protein
MAILTTGNTFVNGDQVTALKLNNAVNVATFASGAVDAVTTVLSGAGAVAVKDGGITAAKLATGVNGALFIGNGTGFTNTTLTAGTSIAVTNASGAITVGVADGGITAVKLETGSNGQLFIGNGTGFTKATLTAGSDMTITNGSGTITIAATAPSTLSSISAANTYAGALNTDLVLGTGNGFAGVTLTVGKWLVTGSVTVRSSTGTTIRLIPVFWDGTTEYSCSTGVETSDLSIRFSVPTSAIMTVASGTRAIVYKIKTSGSNETIDAGTTFGSSSVINAVRLTETP